MSHPSIRIKLLVTLLWSCASISCTHYSVTLNDNLIYVPPDLVRVVNISDARLAACLQQTIEDQGISKPEQLTRLDCSSAGITNLTGLERFSRIQQLGLSNNELKDVEPLFALANLEFVDLRENTDLQCEQVDRLVAMLAGSSRFPEHCLTKIP